MIPIITMLSGSFMPGLFTLLQSLEENGNLPSDQKILIGRLNKFHWKEEMGIKNFPFDIEFFDVEKYGLVQEILPFRYVKNKLALYTPEEVGGLIGLESIYSKIFMFRATEYSKLLWLDVDLLCFGDITEAENFPHLSVAKDYAIELDRIVPEFDNNLMFNTGVMVYEPSEKTFQEVVDWGKRHWKDIMYIRPQSDQTVINSYFWKTRPQEVNFIPQQWNITWKLIGNFPQYFFELTTNDPKFVHYIGEKPWFVDDERFGNIQSIQRVFVEKWRDVFNRAREKMEK